MKSIKQPCRTRHPRFAVNEFIDGTRSTVRIHPGSVLSLSMTNARPVGMNLFRTAWVKFNRLRTGVGRFHSFMHKWSIGPSPNYESGAPKQTANHVLTTCSVHWAPHRARGLRALNDKTRYWLNTIAASM